MSEVTLTAASLLSLLDPPLWIVTSAHDSQRGGLVATSVVSASIVHELPRMVVALARQHHTWDLVEASGALTLHLITLDHLDWVWNFGLSSGRRRDKFAGLEITPGLNGCPILTGALGWLACRVEASLPTGDRTLYLAEVIASGGTGQGTPVTVQAMLNRATAEQKGELKRLLQRDEAIDAAAIRAWRDER